MTTNLTRQLTADALGVPPVTITHDELWDYEMGHADEGACCCLWLRNYHREAIEMDPLMGPVDLITMGEG
jgi:hypothetical protein